MNYINYCYSASLSEDEQLKIDQETQNSREQFTRGFVKGASVSLAAYSLYTLTTSAASAADSSPAPTLPQTPGETGAVQPPTPTPKPGYKGLDETSKGAFIGGSTAICGAALQSGDFYLGVACAFLLVVAGIVINKS